MTDRRKDVFGISGLTNPSYSSPKASNIEHDFIHGNDINTTNDEPQIKESSSDLLQKRMAEIEKNIGCPIFSSSSTLPAASVTPIATTTTADFDQTDSFDTFGKDNKILHASEPHNESFRSFPMSNEGIRRTEEAQKRDKLASALSVLSIDASDGFLDTDRERDRKLEMIEEIEDLVSLFKDDGEDVSKIHIPTVDEPFETIQCTLKILKRHNDRRRFGNLADECIMLAATSLETICDGQRDIFGFRPDLSGWSNHVRAKLRRMHHDTSQIASSIMNDYNIGPGKRLVIELIPNLIMYARNKTVSQNRKDETGDDPEFETTVERLRKR